MTEILTLKPGEKISKPGFYNIPLSVHHTQCCEGVSVTSGVLRRMDLESPADVWAYHDLNPSAPERKQTVAMYMGSAMAALIAGGMAELKKQFLVLKADAPRRPTPLQWAAYEEGRSYDSKTIIACKHWLKVAADPRPPLTHEEKNQLLRMAAVLRDDPAAMAAMEGLPEITMAVQDDATGIWLLARPDTVNPSAAGAYDYKKMATRGEPFTGRLVDQRITKHGYDMQMGFACDVSHRLTGVMPDSVGIVAQWDEYPFHVVPRGFDEDDLEIGMFRNHRALTRFAECLESGHWPGPGEHIGNYRRPEYQAEHFKRIMTI
jgi:hypothetical protein